MKRRYHPGFATKIGPATGRERATLPIDPHVKLPADIQATIDRGEAAFKRSKRNFNRRKGQQPRRNTAVKSNATVPSFITSAVDKNVQDHRDATLDALVQRSRGTRGQPPMLERLRVVRAVVDRLVSEGVRLATGRNSQMNRLVGEWLNDGAARSCDGRKSRRKQLTADAVQRLLKQIKALG